MSADFSYLHFGDTVTFTADVGLLSSNGLVEKHCAARNHDAASNVPYRDFLFQVYPMQRYSAVNAARAWEAQQQNENTRRSRQGGTAALIDPELNQIIDEENAGELEIGVDLERRQNASENQRLFGQRVKYGQIIQLLHCKSSSFLCSHHRTPALIDKSSTLVELIPGGSKSSWLTVMPYHKLRSEGEYIPIGDKVVFAPANGSGNYISCDAEKRYQDFTVEVSASNLRTCWHIQMFLCWRPNLRAFLKAGDVVRLFHIESEKFLLSGDEKVNNKVFCDGGEVQNKGDVTSSNALWEVELDSVDNDASQGVGHWCNLFRLKHVGTGLYLALLPVGKRTREDALNRGKLIDDNNVKRSDVLPGGHEWSAKGDDCSSVASSAGYSDAFSDTATSEAVLGSNDLSSQENKVCIIDSQNPMHTLFIFDPTTTVDFEDPIPKASAIRLKHAATLLWIHATKSPLRLNNSKASRDRMVSSKAGAVKDTWLLCNSRRKRHKSRSRMGSSVAGSESQMLGGSRRIARILLGVGTTRSSDFSDAFSIVSVSKNEVFDTDFVNGVGIQLDYFVESTKVESLLRGSLSKSYQRVCRLAHRVLAELVFFLCDTPAMEPLFCEGTARPGRQKLIREQSIVEKVMDILASPFTDFGNSLIPLNQLQKCHFEPVKLVCQLAFRVVLYTTMDHRENEKYVAQWFAFMQAFIGYEVFAEASLTSIIDNNRPLLEKVISRKEVTAFVKLLEERKDSRYLCFLGALCSVEGSAVTRNQNIVCEKLLNEERVSVLRFPIVGLPGHKNCAGRVYLRDYYRDGLLITSKEEEEYLIELMRLYAECCRDRNYTAILFLRTRLPVAELISAIADVGIRERLRAAFLDLIMCLYVDCDQYVESPPVVLAKLWEELGEAVLHEYAARATMASGSGDEAALHGDNLLALKELLSAQLRRTVHSDGGSIEGKYSYITLSVCQAIRMLTRFRLYSMRELHDLSPTVVAVLRVLSLEASALPSGRINSLNSTSSPHGHESYESDFGSEIGVARIAAETWAIQKYQRYLQTSSNLELPVNEEKTAKLRLRSTMVVSRMTTMKAKTNSGEAPKSDPLKDTSNRRTRIDRRIKIARKAMESAKCLIDMLDHSADMRLDFRISSILGRFKAEHTYLNMTTVEPGSNVSCDSNSVAQTVNELFNAVRDVLLPYDNLVSETVESLVEAAEHLGRHIKAVNYLLTCVDGHSQALYDRMSLLMRVAKSERAMYTCFLQFQNDSGSNTLLTFSHEEVNDLERFHLSFTSKYEVPAHASNVLERYSVEDLFRDDNPFLNSDHCGGTTLVPVLLQLLVLDRHPTLVTAAVGLLLRLFSQRNELASAIKHVQLLVTPAAVQTYKEIEVTLTQLRNLRDRAELWLSRPWFEQPAKSTPDEDENENEEESEPSDDVDGSSDASEVEEAPEWEQLYMAILNLGSLCVKKSDKNENDSIQQGRPTLYDEATPPPPVDKESQHILKNLRCHIEILECLKQIPFIRTDFRVVHIFQGAYKFLQAFCRDNPKNQSLLWEHRDLFLSQMGAGVGAARLMRKIIENNVHLCSNIKPSSVGFFIVAIERRQRSVSYLKFLKAVVMVGGHTIHKNQIMVARQLCNSEDSLQLYTDELSVLTYMVREFHNEYGYHANYKVVPVTNPLLYHITLVSLLALCVRGYETAEAALQCRGCLPLDNVLDILISSDMSSLVKKPYLMFLNDCYLDCELKGTLLFGNNKMWKLLELWVEEIICLQMRLSSSDVSGISTSYIRSEPLNLVRLYMFKYVLVCFCRFVEYHFNMLPLLASQKEIMQRMLCDALLPLALESSLSSDEQQYVFTAIHSIKTQLFVVSRDVSQADENGLVVDNDIMLQIDVILQRTTHERRSSSLKSLIDSDAMEDNPKTILVSSVQKSDSESENTNTVINALLKLSQQLYQHLEPYIMAEHAVAVSVFRNGNLFRADTRNSQSQVFKELKSTSQKSFRNESSTDISVYNGDSDDESDDVVDDGSVSTENDPFLSKLVSSAWELSRQGQKKLCVELLETLQDMIMKKNFSDFIKIPEAMELYERDCSKFFIMCCPGQETSELETKWSSNIDNEGNNVENDQDSLCVHGAASLVVNLVKNSPTPSVYTHSIELGIALLYGGNSRSQDAFLKLFLRDSNEGFFREIVDRMRQAVYDLNLSRQIESNPSSESEDTSESASERRRRESKAETNHLGVSFGTSRAGNNVAKTLRFLQLLCEDHSEQLQHFIRDQHCKKRSFNLVKETLSFLAELCGGSASSVGIYVTETNAHLVMQCLMTLSEFCQGPCALNQEAVISHGDVSIEVAVTLASVLVRPLVKTRPDLALKLSHSALVFLMSVTERRADGRKIYARLLQHVESEVFINLINEIFLMYRSLCCSGSENAKLHAMTALEVLEVGHTAYLFACYSKVASPRISALLRVHPSILNKCNPLASSYSNNVLVPSSGSSGDMSTNAALIHYHLNTGSVEIVRDGTLERVFFPIPFIFHHLTRQSKKDALMQALKHRNSNVQRLDVFISLASDLMDEMRWRDRLQAHKMLWWFSHTRPQWRTVSFVVGVLLNVLLVTDVVPSWVMTIFGILSIFAAACVVVGYLADFGMIFYFTYWLNRRHSRRAVMQYINDPRSRLQNYYVLLLCVTMLGTFVSPYFFPLLLFDLVAREETLQSVIRSITHNLRAFLLTLTFGITVIYVFAVLGYLYHADDFVIEGEQRCGSLATCLSTTISLGLRSGGGIGDVLMPPPTDVALSSRFFYDLVFYFIVVLVLLNMIGGVVLDAFADLREEKSATEEFKKNSCFICSIGRETFDVESVGGFDTHVDRFIGEHNLWNYLAWVVHLFTKSSVEFTGSESFVYSCLRAYDLSWIPQHRAMSLQATSKSDVEESSSREENESSSMNQATLASLSSQVIELQQLVAEQAQLLQSILNGSTKKNNRLSRTNSNISTTSAGTAPQLSSFINTNHGILGRLRRKVTYMQNSNS